MTEQPTTAAGRSLQNYPLIDHMDKDALGGHIRAIEAEMYDRASNEGYHAGIADCKEHDPAHAGARQQDGSALPSVETLTAWLREDYAAEAATSGGNPFSTRKPDEFVASRIHSRLAALPPSAPPALDVKRLQDAMERSVTRLRYAFGDGHIPGWGVVAHKVAAEYARLQEQAR